MSYEEIEYYDGSFQREWMDEKGEYHREDGPASICYRSDGSIFEEDFYLHGKYLGENKEGFWALWDRLDEDKRNNPELLKYLVRFS
jgi:hypothetical protein